EVRARLLAAARAHFFAAGYSALTMDDLAAELGMSKKTLYVYFPGKDALIEAILREFVAEVRASADEARTTGDRGALMRYLRARRPA
ncbi:MAG: helix-turn-helix transcriptional regulator, partial [Planctomycetes bacterium]|nr:helix-turn-helix transcriptional regulator [Planctomycetota bacterium]